MFFTNTDFRYTDIAVLIHRFSIIQAVFSFKYVEFYKSLSSRYGDIKYKRHHSFIIYFFKLNLFFAIYI